MAGKACDYHSKALFKVLVDGEGFAEARFKKVSGLKMQVEVEEIREGGALIPEKFPGVASTENVWPSWP